MRIIGFDNQHFLFEMKWVARKIFNGYRYNLQAFA